MHTRHTLFLSLSLLLLACSAQADPQATGTAPILKWLWTQGEHFAEHPELVGESGTGWKQYARTQHFYEGRRKPDGTLPTVDELRRLRTDHDMRSQAARRIGNPYFELGPTNIGGRVLDIEFDPNVPGRLYAATAGGGLARSTDDGNSWTMITDQLPSLSTSAISVNPNDSNKLILATGGQPTVGLGLGIFYSLDGGASWQPSNIIDNTPWIGFNRLLVTPTGAVHLAFSDQGIYRSTDDGATWSQVVVSGNWWDAMIVDTTIFAVAGDDSLGNGGIYRSFDVGQTWFKSGTGQPTAANVGKSRLAESQGTIFALIGDLVNDSSLGLWTSVDNGDNWVQNLTGPETGTNYRGSLGIGNQIRSGFNLALAVDPSNANNIMTGGQYGLLSTDGGLTWTAQEQTTNDVDTPHVDYHAAVWRNGTLWVGTDGGIYTTDDLGVTWTPRNSGMGSYLFNSVAVAQTDLSVMFGGAQDNRGSGSVGATQWQYGSGLRGDGSLGAIDPTNALNVYIDMQNGNHYRSTDGGVSFVQSNSGFGGDNTSGAFVNPLAMDPNTPLTLYAATNSNNCACGNGLWRTTDGMQNWTQIDTGRPRVIGVSKVSSNTIWTVRNGSGDLRVSTDWFATFNDTALPLAPTGVATDLETIPGNDGACLITYDGYSTGGLHVLYAAQYGAAVVDVTGNLPDVPANAVAADPQNPTHWYVGTDLGVYVSTNQGVAWEPFGMGLPNAVVTDLQIHDSDRKLIVATYGRGAWVTDLNTATAAPPSVAQPRNLMLDPPSPNPSAGQTMLRFAAKGSGDATLDVYNAAGRRVDSLGTFRADGVVRMISWQPQQTAAGVYYAVLRSGTEKVTRKIVFAR